MTEPKKKKTLRTRNDARARAVDWGAVRASALSGVPLRDLARRLRIPESTVLRHAQREKWGVRETRAEGNRQALVQSNEAAQAAASSLADLGNQTRYHLGNATHSASEHLAALPSGEILQKTGPLKDLVTAANHLHGWDEGRGESRLAINVAFLRDPEGYVATSNG